MGHVQTSQTLYTVKMSNLLELLQPKEYKSKLKLFCREIKVEKLAYIKDNNYLCNQERKPTIKIVEL